MHVIQYFGHDCLELKTKLIECIVYICEPKH